MEESAVKSINIIFDKLYKLINKFVYPSDSSRKPNGKLGPMNPTNPALYDFIRNLFSEIVQVFPDQYLHLGGDEVPFDCWGSNPEIGDYMKAHNMSNRYELLENQYIAKILAISKSLDANTIVWQEVSVFFLQSFLLFFTTNNACTV